MSCPRPAPDQARRRARPAVALVAALVLAGSGALSGCGLLSSSGAAAPAAVASNPEPTHHAVEDNAFPVRVTHRYGETELAEPPDRIVTLGLHDADTLISLGMRPVGIRDWPGTQHTYDQWPWAPDDLGPDAIAVASPRGSIDFDAVAALEPDLITAVYSDLSEADYQHLTEIAPTIAQPPDAEDYQSSWQEETRLLAKAIGRPRQAEDVIVDTEAAFADVRTRHPVLSDADVALVTYAADRTLRLVNPYDPRARFFAALGMRFPDSVAAAVGEHEFDAPTGLRALAGLADLDALVWLGDPAAQPADLAVAAARLQSDPAYADLDVVRRGASVFLAAGQAVALGSGPSLAYAATKDGPRLADAMDAKARDDRTGSSPGPLPGEDPAAAKPDPSKTPKPGKSAKPTPGPTPTTGPTDPAAIPPPTAAPPAQPTPPTVEPGPWGPWAPPTDAKPERKPGHKRHPRKNR